MKTTTEQLREFAGKGYEAFSREYYAHRNEPNVRFSNSSFRFNQAAVNALEQTDKVSILINEGEKMLIVCPASENDAHSSRWAGRSNPNEQIRPRTIASSAFVKQLYQAMQWQSDYDYRIHGTAVQTQTGPMLLFALGNTETIVHLQAPLRIQ